MNAQAQMHGVAPVLLVADEPYMMREFQVRDPDGHLLAFGRDISGQQANG